MRIVQALTDGTLDRGAINDFAHTTRRTGGLPHVNAHPAGSNVKHVVDASVVRHQHRSIG